MIIELKSPILTVPTPRPSAKVTNFRLEAEQLAKIGYLYLRGGMWNDQRILDESFVKQATARQVDQVNRFGWGYGYQWWRLDQDGATIWAGLGFGGQYLLVIPEHDLVGVINSWNIFGERVQNVLPAFIDALLATTN